MNYLFHIYFSTTDPATQLGACLGDFYKGNIANLDCSTALKKGLALHRALDTFADTHPLLLHCRAAFPKEQRRMAGIALDIFFDHFLAKHWESYCTIPLQTFCQTFYTTTKPLTPLLTPEAAYVHSLIANENWLAAYADLKTITFVLTRMSRAIHFKNTLEETPQTLIAQYAFFEDAFRQFIHSALKSFEQGHENAWQRGI